MTANPSSGLETAIIGMACRCPGAGNAAALWRNLESGTESIRVFSDEELQGAGVDSRVCADPSYVKARGVLDDVDRFDPAFFDINPREAELMDPQHRFFLECAWEALEDAGICPAEYGRPIGVYAGAGPDTYLLHLYANRALVDSVGGFQLALGNDKDYLTTRVSYKLNLTGPSVTVQTACSTSLVAVHLAIQALLGGECDVAIAGGVSIRLPQIAGYLYQENGILSPDGHCRAFDRRAQGTVPGNGVGVVVLKRLSDALADGDRIEAVIKGSAVVNDGSRRAGFTAPGLDGQVKAIRTAHAVAGVAPETITYIEAHGSGTPLGDRVELEALARAFRSAKAARGRCAIGSIKTNVGHLDAAAGVAGLIKTALAMKHRKIPASLHFSEPNPHLDLEATPFYVSAQLHEWTGAAGPLRAGVSSMGIGGTNAHLVLEEPPARVAEAGLGRRHVWLLSAKTDTCLDRATDRLAEYLRHNPDVDGADVAYTLQVGRTHFACRRMLVASDAADALSALESRDPARVRTVLQPDGDRPVALLFPAAGVGHDDCAALARSQPELRPYLETCAELFRPHIGSHLLERRTSRSADGDLDAAALFAVQYALAQLWQAWGVRPQAVSGYGVGACAAACVSGILDLDDAVALVGIRDRDARAKCLGAMQLKPPAIPCFSAARRTWITSSEGLDPEHWIPERHQGSHDTAAIRELTGGGDRVVLEIGRSAAFVAEQSAPPIVASLPTASEGEWCPDLLHVLGRLWQEGARVDWARFHARERRQRIRLPTYPFDRQRYWADRSDASTGEDQPRPARNADPATWLYVPTWKRSVRTEAPRAAPSARERKRSWLVFLDTAGVGDAIVRGLRRTGQSVATIEAGQGFAWTAARAYVLDPFRREDYERVCADLRRSGGIPDVIVHAWGVDATAPASDGTPSTGRAYRDFYSLLYLARALAVTTNASHELCVVSSEVYDVAGSGLLSPIKSTIIGPCRVIPQECPGVSCRIIDVDPAWYRSDDGCERHDDLAATLIDEIAREQPEPAVAYRCGVRWLPIFEPAHVPRVSVEATPLRPGGVYLITGGLGAIGLTLAEHLARSVRARLVLISRSPFPRADEWPHLESSSREIGSKAGRLLAMQAAGAEVLVFSANVADSGGMRRVVDETYARFGAIHGVVHAAGLVGDSAFRTVREAREEECQWHFRPKIDGLLCLYALLRDRDIDFWLLMSSLASVLGGVGFSAYAAANIFMDSFAQRHRAARTRWISVNWDTWRFREGNARPKKAGAGIADYSMSPDEGVDIFQRSLALAEPQVVVSTGDLRARLGQWVYLSSLRASQGDARPKPRHPRPRLQTAYVAPTRGLDCAIAAHWQDLLGIDAVGVHDDFFELGGQSLLAIQLMNRLRETCGVQVPVRQIFQARTIAELSLAVAQALAEQIDPDALTSLADGVAQGAGKAAGRGSSRR